ncbi:hypothetical protein LOZ39_003820 [Ophidiomyces ophidiicola]|nr:hypothetical protein LOZ39_003820 [Ophidiomyces ophidiicola]KAI2134824.1 hypothetical protein LOZ29_004081 [Ophidiomyces ophidiicola]KAI2356748.1 hypothetical protein LOY92_000502 [Ophidiomyces ophidiicola]KAI2426258.1 hypothetical protein LOZ52_004016 [Ophidiomyces ophidiicola]KAI2447719.1 hypothetical protein LOZ08_000063 [Ophidiomyces ophidiicola]
MPRRSSRVNPGVSTSPDQGDLDCALSSTKKSTKRPRSTDNLPQRSRTRTTPKKSRYFKRAKKNPVDELSASGSDVASSPTSAETATAADSYVPETDDEEENEQSLDDEDDQEYESENGPTARKQNIKTPKGVPRKGKELEGTPISKGKELWREGVRTGLGPGKEVFIELPQARDAGDIPYEDHTIHPNTLLFLEDLKANNNREWLKRHDSDYRTSKKDWDTFVEQLSEKIIEKDSTIPELPVKDLVFRIYRDVRFTNDPTPYKVRDDLNWFQIAVVRTAFLAVLSDDVSHTSQQRGPVLAAKALMRLIMSTWNRESVSSTTQIEFNVSISPSNNIVSPGSGLWMPDGGRLARLRRDIDSQSERIKLVLSHPDVRKSIFDGIPNDEKKVVKSFVSQNQENALKTKPKGYDSDNPNIELLRLRSFTINKKLRDREVLGGAALDGIAAVIETMVPFTLIGQVTYLNSVVMPDAETDEES